MLTAKQARFVDEYLIDLNATQAAIRAGYSDKFSNSNAPKLLQNTAIAEAIKEAQAKLSEACLVSQKMVIDGLLVEARLNGEGSSHSARVSAWGLLGKHLGMFVDKVDLNAKIKKVPKLEIVLTKETRVTPKAVSGIFKSCNRDFIRRCGWWWKIAFNANIGDCICY